MFRREEEEIDRSSDGSVLGEAIAIAIAIELALS